MKIRVFLVLPLLLFFGIITIDAQNVTIDLKTNSPNSIVRLIRFDDLLNWHGETIFLDTANSQGVISMQADWQKIAPAHLSVNLDRVDLVLKPAASYSLEIDAQLQQENLSYFDKTPPALLIAKADDEGLQQQLESIERLTNSFVLDNFQALFRLKKYALLDSLKLQLDKLVAVNSLEYSRQYAHYKYASIVLAVQRDGENRVINDFFKGQEVQYNNTAYMSLFVEVFSDYLLGNRNLAMESLRETGLKSYTAWRDYLRNDPLLQEDNRLSELIVLASLKYLYYDSRFKAKEVRKYLTHLSQNAIYAEHQRMAKNTIEAFQFLAPATKAPVFELYDQDGKQIKLLDFKESMVLLHFVDKNCRTCMASLEQLHEMKTELKDVQIVSLATAESFGDYKRVFASKNYDWPLLNLDRNILLLEAYNVKTFPELILLLPEAKIGMAPISLEKEVLFFHFNRLRP